MMQMSPCFTLLALTLLLGVVHCLNERSLGYKDVSRSNDRDVLFLKRVFMDYNKVYPQAKNCKVVRQHLSRWHIKRQRGVDEAYTFRWELKEDFSKCRGYEGTEYYGCEAKVFINLRERKIQLEPTPVCEVLLRQQGQKDHDDTQQQIEDQPPAVQPDYSNPHGGGVKQ